MKKKIQKVFSGILCCSVLTGILGTTSCATQTAASSSGMAAQIQAEEMDLTYTFDRLKVAAKSNADGTVNSAKQMDVNFTEQWGQIVFEVPEEINFEQVLSVTFNAASGADTSSLATKTFNEKGISNFTEVQVNYSGLNLNVSNPDGIKYVGLMNMKAANRNVKFDSVTFTVDPSKIKVTSIEQNIPAWKNSITKAFGKNTVAGGAIMYSEISDELLMDLVEKHFNAVTFGNELKPDAMLGNALPTEFKEIEISGKRLTVPAKINTVDSNAERMLKKIKAWNDSNPKNRIRIRGHVLVWHSQTPEWFFHQDYNPSKPDADKETMTLRQEWYIREILTYFAGESSPYRDMFYGWDVVNEAVSDSSGTYRTDKENSSWWRVFKSNEFITNAFVFANRYAPAHVALFYNDYGDTSPTKSKGIVQLLKDVKATPGARIDGFGMQAHYGTDSFNREHFEAAARAYGAVVKNIQLTELDFQTHKGFKNTKDEKRAELTKMAYCHKQIFDTLKKVHAEKAANVTGITTWGIIEPNSWLHAHANVGGGADGTTKQCPLLFDGNYRAKPLYWAYVDSSRLEPEVQNIVIEKEQGKTFATAASESIIRISGEGAEAQLYPVWDENGVTVFFKVSDKSKDSSDSVTVYVDAEGALKDKAKVLKATASRSESAEVSGGYEGKVFVPAAGLGISKTIGFDAKISNGAKVASYNNVNNTQEDGSRFYAKALLKPATITISRGSATVDGEVDAAWNSIAATKLEINLDSKVSAEAKTMWDESNLYVLITVKDSSLDNANSNAWEQDSAEIFVDENNHKSPAYEADDKQYRINYKNVQSYNGTKCNSSNIKSAAKEIAGGYVIEAAIKWTDIKPASGTEIGIEFQINDALNGARIGTLSWFDATGQGYTAPSVFGTAVLR